MPPVLSSRIVEIKPAAAPSGAPFWPPAAPPASPEAAPPPSDPPVGPSSPSPAREEAPARKRAPRKPAPAAEAGELGLEAPPARFRRRPPPPRMGRPASSSRPTSGSATGFSSAEAVPGLSWDKGVPLSFVSIGKWRWETGDATAPVQFKLYKNDEIECTALGERSLDPGVEQALTATF